MSVLNMLACILFATAAFAEDIAEELDVTGTSTPTPIVFLGVTNRRPQCGPLLKCRKYVLEQLCPNRQKIAPCGDHNTCGRSHLELVQQFGCVSQAF